MNLQAKSLFPLNFNGYCLTFVINFSVDCKLFVLTVKAFKETEIVVFETLYREGTEIAVHADIEDENQTVTIHPQPEPEKPQTGDDSNLGFYIGLGSVAVGGLIAFLIIKFKKKDEDDE